MGNQDAVGCVIGVLALQGSFREHRRLLTTFPNVTAVEVRTKAQLKAVDGLIIPGGESTTMAFVAEKEGLMDSLRAFVQSRAPTWGTCAGMIFLADRAEGQKIGGQTLLGGLDILVSRNFFGAQINSFEAELQAPPSIMAYGSESTFRGVFIRAPAVVETGPDVEVLAECPLSSSGDTTQGGQDNSNSKNVAVAVRSVSSAIMATAFHPELTEDTRWHALFVDMVRQHVRNAGSRGIGDSSKASSFLSPSIAAQEPADLPVFSADVTQPVAT